MSSTLKKAVKQRKAIGRPKRIDPEIARRISLLRAERGEKQEEFAKRLGVSQTTVSAWEKGKSYPLPEAWLNLSTLARDEDRAWFWKRGGQGLDKMILAAANYLKNRRRPAEKGELIRIAPLDAQGADILLPAERVPNPDSTSYIVLESPTCGDALARSDIVVIDRLDSEKDPRSLEPFWGRLIAVKFTRPAGAWPTGFSVYWQHGFSVGRPFPVGRIEGDKCLGTVTFFPSAGVAGPGDLSLGHWEESLPIASTKEEEDRAIERAVKQFRLPEGLEVIGEVISIFLGPGNFFTEWMGRSSRD